VKQNREGKECGYVRVYANWDVPSVVQQPMRARIAGRVTPSSTQSGPASLEMIELPLKMTPNVIACCQVRDQFDGCVSVSPTKIIIIVLYIHEEILHFDTTGFLTEH
jgi:hypothetical protein